MGSAKDETLGCDEAVAARCTPGAVAEKTAAAVMSDPKK
jgi:hypothetical protein